jgi:hypothetical protein
MPQQLWERKETGLLVHDFHCPKECRHIDDELLYLRD